MDWIYVVSRSAQRYRMNEDAAEIRTPLLDFPPPRCWLLASANLTSTNHKWTQSL